MRTPPLAEILEQLSRHDDSSLKELHVGVLRNVTVEGIEPYLRYLARRDGLAVRVRFGAYDTILQEVSGAVEPPLSPDTKVVLVFLWLPAFSPGLAYRFATLTEDAVQEEVARVKAYAAACIQGIRSITAAPILWHGVEAPAYPSLGVLDDGYAAHTQSTVLHELNRFLATELRAARNGYFVDVTRCVLRLGESRFYDWRYWHIGRAPFSREALSEIAEEDYRHMRALVGKARKCLVLDCDEVLWGGIVGEDGLDGIKLGPSHPGSAYVEFQYAILNLYHRGVILALCSRNNPSDVLRVLREHPAMVLREEHFASIQVNWSDKATNIKAIASELNIGLDSMVFADDSDFEIDMVRTLLPEVELLHLPAARASENRARLGSCGLFDTLSLSDEDRRRGELYRAEARRREQRSRVTGVTEYLESLEMRAWIGRVDSRTSERAAQLTQRTNQFNLTAKRYTVADMQALAGSADHDALIVQLADRFGDYGFVGLAILAYHSGYADVDTFLLSCRVLGRRVEDVLLDACVRAAHTRGVSRLIGQYVPTNRNDQVREFFPQRGFAPCEVSVSGASFELSLDAVVMDAPRHFAAIEIAWEDGGDRRTH